MKKIIALLFIITIAFSAFSQQNNLYHSSQYYLKKSKKQKTTGRILLIGGGVLVIGTFVAAKALNNPGYGLILLPVAGVGMAIASIPFLNASVRNKRKASKVSAYLKLDNLPAFRPSGKHLISYPSLAVKINLKKSKTDGMKKDLLVQL